MNKIPGRAISYNDRWKRVYDACGFSDLRLDEFLQAPWYHLTARGQESAPMAIKNGLRPLLPRQAAIAKHLRQQELDQPRSSFRRY